MPFKRSSQLSYTPEGQKNVYRKPEKLSSAFGGLVVFPGIGYLGAMGLWSFFKEKRRQRLVATRPIPQTEWEAAVARLYILQRLDEVQLAELRRLATIFLAEKRFRCLGDFESTPEIRLAIALQACLPLLKLGLDWLSSLRTIYLRLQPFTDRRQFFDGLVMTEYDDELSGEVTEFGSVVLSLEDVELAGQGSGYNVIIHEMAHILDDSNMAVDGAPWLTQEQDPERWKAVFTAAFADLKRRRYGRPPLDVYATENPAEFFAVVCEEFFERPRRLRRHYPEVCDCLAGFFGWDPGDWEGPAGTGGEPD